MPGKGDVELTGQLGDVMKESARTAVSFVRSVSEEYQIPENTFKEYDFHELQASFTVNLSLHIISNIGLLKNVKVPLPVHLLKL